MNVWMQFVGSAGIAVVLAAVVNGVFNKRKLSAEATQIITDAAGSMVVRLEHQVADLSSEQARQRRHQQLTDERLAVHAAWDRQAQIAAERQGFQLPPPPPLFSVESTPV
jgi:hypothetical protein